MDCNLYLRCIRRHNNPSLAILKYPTRLPKWLCISKRLLVYYTPSLYHLQTLVSRRQLLIKINRTENPNHSNTLEIIRCLNAPVWNLADNSGILCNCVIYIIFVFWQMGPTQRFNRKKKKAPPPCWTNCKNNKEKVQSIFLPPTLISIILLSLNFQLIDFQVRCSTVSQSHFLFLSTWVVRFTSQTLAQHLFLQSWSTAVLKIYWKISTATADGVS